MPARSKTATTSRTFMSSRSSISGKEVPHNQRLQEARRIFLHLSSPFSRRPNASRTISSDHDEPYLPLPFPLCLSWFGLAGLSRGFGSGRLALGCGCGSGRSALGCGCGSGRSALGCGCGSGRSALGCGCWSGRSAPGLRLWVRPLGFGLRLRVRPFGSVAVVGPAARLWVAVAGPAVRRWVAAVGPAARLWVAVAGPAARLWVAVAGPAVRRTGSLRLLGVPGHRVLSARAQPSNRAREPSGFSAEHVLWQSQRRDSPQSAIGESGTLVGSSCFGSGPAEGAATLASNSCRWSRNRCTSCPRLPSSCLSDRSTCWNRSGLSLLLVRLLQRRGNHAALLWPPSCRVLVGPPRCAAVADPRDRGGLGSPPVGAVPIRGPGDAASGCERRSGRSRNARC